MKLSEKQVRVAVEQFSIYGRLEQIGPYGSGHINDTFLSVFDQAGVAVRYIHQRVNNTVFERPDRLMDNIARVTSHLKEKGRSRGDSTRSYLTLVPTKDGSLYHIDDNGYYWRTYLFIAGARTYNVVETEEQAEAAAFAFGEFQRDLSDVPAPPLHETIVDFHNSPKRLARLEDVIAGDSHGRVSEAEAEIEFVRNRAEDLSLLLSLKADGRIPERITHNDTKLNNVMLDDVSGKGVCVIDLDTVMPGIVHYDFGDLVRSSTSPVAEDEPDATKVVMRLPMFRALARGYLRSAGEFLTETEVEYLPFAGRLMTLTIGIRFLTDFLSGDVYFKTSRPGHNLDRARTQFALVDSMETQWQEMTEVVRRESER